MSYKSSFQPAQFLVEGEWGAKPEPPPA